MEESNPNRPVARRFSKTGINFWIDFFLLCVFLTLCWSSVVVRYVFPPAVLSEGWSLWGLDYLTWTDVQFGCLCVMVACVLIHVMMHWPWVCGVINTWRKHQGKLSAAESLDSGSRTLWGVGLLIVLLNILGLGIALAAFAIQGPTS